LIYLIIIYKTFGNGGFAPKRDLSADFRCRIATLGAKETLSAKPEMGFAKFVVLIQQVLNGRCLGE
jgi:hypothetical protein